MRRFPLGLAVVLLTLTSGSAALAAEPKPTVAAVPDPQDELRLGREAYAHGDHANAAVHLARAAAGFQVTGDRESLAAAYLELGRVELVGLGEPEKALAAFLRSADIAARPAGALGWAATAADKLGLSAEARRYRERAQEPAAKAKTAAPAADAGPPAPAADTGSPAPGAAAGSPPHRPIHYRDKEMALDAPAPAAPAAQPAPAAANDHPAMTTFYLVLLRRSPAWTPDESPAIQRLQEAHMANIRRLAGEGKLVIAGPFLEQTGPGSLAGLYIFRAPSLDAVKELAATDPMVRSGRLVPEIYPWLGPKGLHY